MGRDDSNAPAQTEKASAEDDEIARGHDCTWQPEVSVPVGTGFVDVLDGQADGKELAAVGPRARLSKSRRIGLELVRASRSAAAPRSDRRVRYAANLRVYKGMGSPRVSEQEDSRLRGHVSTTTTKRNDRID